MHIQNHICSCNKCQKDVRDKILTGSGAKTTYKIFNHPDRYQLSKIIVDDCLLKTLDRSEKCDYLFLVKETNQAYFIECKGSDVLKAVGQLDATVNILEKELKDHSFFGRIIATRTYSPDIKDKRYKDLYKKLKGNLITKNIQYHDHL